MKTFTKFKTFTCTLVDLYINAAYKDSSALVSPYARNTTWVPAVNSTGPREKEMPAYADGSRTPTLRNMYASQKWFRSFPIFFVSFPPRIPPTRLPEFLTLVS